jgi:hypothetical protein
MIKEQMEKRLEALEAELPKLRSENDLLRKGSIVLEKRAVYLANDVQAEIAQQKVLQAEIDRLNLELVKANDQPLLKAFSDFVEDRLKTYDLAQTAGRETAQMDQTLPLLEVKTKIPVRVETRTLPEVSTLTTKGKIVLLIRHGKLDAKKRQAEISAFLPQGIHKLEVMGALNQLVEEQVLIKVKEDASHVAFVKHPDVEAVQAGKGE